MVEIIHGVACFKKHYGKKLGVDFWLFFKDNQLEIDCIREQSLNEKDETEEGSEAEEHPDVEQSHDHLQAMDGLLDSKMSMNSQSR